MIGLPVKISVIIPIYNVEQYLGTCLGSCAEQTLNDVEFICINDGSTDRSLEIIKTFAEKDHRFRIIDKENGGVSAARNTGLDAAMGEYIMFLDADDYLEPNACERVWLEKLEAPTDIVVFSSNIFPRNPQPIPWYYSVLTCPTRRYWEYSTSVLFGEPSTRPFIWHQAFRKEILDENNIRFPENLEQGEDQAFLFMVYPHATNFCFIQDYLYNYRWYRENSAMWKFSKDKDMDLRVTKHMDMIEVITEYWHNKGWLESDGLEYFQWVLDFVVMDMHNKKTKNSKEHFQRLKDLIAKYNFDKFYGKLTSHHQSLAELIPNKTN